ncbi:MAG: tetratricopeptide repeat protein [Bacteroidia bacterium]|nr:tetratricopeptide repeat protein [Bacteroidia bacterium]MDW8346532.1 tetratricopeptide repeat protein [Bacteroidia bacterium]
MQKGIFLYNSQKYDSASYYFRKAYQHAAQQRNVSLQKESIKHIITAELYAEYPDTALKYANLMYITDFEPFEVYLTKENIFRKFLYYDSAALYAAKYSSSAPKSGIRDEIHRLKKVITAYYEAYYYDLALFYCKSLLKLSEVEYSKTSPEYAEIKLLVAGILAKRGEIEPAKAAIDQAIQIYRKYPESPELLAYAQYAKSVLLTEIGNYLPALSCILSSINGFKKQLGEAHVATAKAFLQLGILHEKINRYDSAFYYQKKALALFKSLLPQNDLLIAKALQAIGNTYFAQQNYEKAEEYYQNALFIQKQQYVQYHPQLAETYKNLGRVMEAKKHGVLCYRFYELAHKIYLRTLGQKHIEIAQSYIQLGTAYFLKKETQKSLEYYLKGLHNLEHNPELSNHEYSFQAYQKLSVLYQTEGNYEKAIEYAQKAIHILKNKVISPSVYLSEQYLRLAGLYRLSKQYTYQIEAHQSAIDALCTKSVTQTFGTPLPKDVILEEKTIPLLIQKANLIIEQYAFSFSTLQPVTFWANHETKIAYQDSRQEYELNSALNALELTLELSYKLFKQGQHIPLPDEVPQKMTFLSWYLYQITGQKYYIEKLLTYTELFARLKYQFSAQNLKFYLSSQDSLVKKHIQLNQKIHLVKKDIMLASKNEYRTDTHWVRVLVQDYQKIQVERHRMWEMIEKHVPQYYYYYYTEGLSNLKPTNNENFITFLSLTEISQIWKSIKNENHPLFKAQVLHYLPLTDGKSAALLINEECLHLIPLSTIQETFLKLSALDSAMKQKNVSCIEKICINLYADLFEPLKDYLKCSTLIVFGHGAFDRLCVEILLKDKKISVHQKYKVLYAFSWVHLLKQATEKPKTLFNRNVCNVRQPITALNNPVFAFKPIMNTTTDVEVDIFHTDTAINYSSHAKPLSCYLYISDYCNVFIPKLPMNCFTLFYPIEIEVEKQFWDEFYENLAKRNTVWDSFYAAQRRIHKIAPHHTGRMRLFIAKI